MSIYPTTTVLVLGLLITLVVFYGGFNMILVKYKEIEALQKNLNDSETKMFANSKTVQELRDKCTEQESKTWVREIKYKTRIQELEDTISKLSLFMGYNYENK